MRVVALRKSESESKELHEKEEIPHHHTPESIILSLLRDGFKAEILRIKENRDGTESWKVVLRK